MAKKDDDGGEGEGGDGGGGAPPAPVVKREKRPPVARPKRQCPNCDATTDGKFCGSCGARIEEDGAVSTNLAEQTARNTADIAKLAPLGKLVDRLAARGLSVDDVKDEHLDGLAKVKKNGLGGLLGGMGKLFPPLPGMGGFGGFGGKPPADDDTE